MKKRQRMNDYLRRKARKPYMPQSLVDRDRSKEYLRILWMYHYRSTIGEEDKRK